MAELGELAPSPRDAFVHALQHAWTALIGRGLFLSGHDTALAEQWFAQGLPLDVVVEGLRTALAERQEKGGRKALPMRLSYYAFGVDQARARLLELSPGPVVSVAAPLPAPEATPSPDTRSAEDRAALERLALSAEAPALREAARACLRAGGSTVDADAAPDVDEQLQDALWAALEPEELARLEAEVAARLLREPPMGPRGRELRRRALLRQALARDYGLVRVTGEDS